MAVNSFGQSVGESVIMWQPKKSPDIDKMEGVSCYLVKLMPEDHAKDLYQVFCQANHEKNWTYLPYGPFVDFESFNQWLTQNAVKSDPIFYTIIDKLTNEAVGLASYLRINPSVGVVEVGHIHFSEKIQKTILATEAMYLMMQYVFDVLGYRRYEWKCDDLNLSSKHAAKRLGFSYEGTFKQATIYKGRNRDTSWFSIIDKDWPTLKLAFNRWLHSDNFDENGEQKEKLMSFY